MAVHVGVRGPGHLSRVFGTFWDPTQLTSTVAWWDASQGVTQSGGLVSDWADKVGAVSVVQATGSLKPIYSATSMNSAYPGISPDGADDYLAKATVPGSFPTGSASGWMFVLADQQRAAAATTPAEVVSYGDGVSQQCRDIVRNVVTGVNRATASQGALDTSEPTIDFSGIHAVTTIYTAGTEIARIDGRESGSGAVTINTATARLRIGAWSATAASNYFLGVISHVLIGTGVLSTAEKEKLEAWALWSVGKQSQLPVGHTYQNARP